MRFKEKKITLKDVTEGVLRNVEPKDAKEMIGFLKEVSGETHFLLRSAEDVTFTEEKEKEILGAILESENQVMITAFVDGEIVGNASISPISRLPRMKHRASFAIAIKKKFWGKGLGTILIEEALIVAKNAGYEQVELGVYEDNDRAKALYERFGFEEWGRMKRSFKLKDGSYRDEIMMGKIL